MGGRKRMLAFHRDYPDAIAIVQPPVAQLPASARVPQPVAQLPWHQNETLIEKADALRTTTDCCPRQLSGNSGHLDLAITRVPRRGCGNVKEFGHGG